MLFLLSPAKTLDFEAPLPAMAATEPLFPQKTAELAAVLAEMPVAEMAALMDLSPKLAQLNYDRYQLLAGRGKAPSKPALAVFRGDVYQSMQVADYTKQDWEFAQQHGAILSGLYGVLRPLDAIQPYRLEMGTRLKHSGGIGLYGFWRDAITRQLQSWLAGHRLPVLLNLASQEYAEAVAMEVFGDAVIHVHFKEEKAGKLATIGLFAKRARGMMANQIIRQRWDHPDQLKEFAEAGYRFVAELSNAQSYIFIR